MGEPLSAWLTRFESLAGTNEGSFSICDVRGDAWCGNGDEENLAEEVRVVFKQSRASLVFCLLNGTHEERWSGQVLDRISDWMEQLHFAMLLMPLTEANFTRRGDEKVKIICDEISQEVRRGRQVLVLCDLNESPCSMLVGCALIALGVAPSAQESLLALQAHARKNRPSPILFLSGAQSDDPDPWLGRIKSFEIDYYRQLDSAVVGQVLARIREERQSDAQRERLLIDLKVISLVSREEAQRMLLLSEAPLFATIVYRADRAAQVLALSILSRLIQRSGSEKHNVSLSNLICAGEAVEALHSGQCVLSLTALLASCAVPFSPRGDQKQKRQGDEEFAENLLFVLAKVVEHSRNAIDFARANGVSSLLLVLENSTDENALVAAGRVLLQVSVWGREVQAHLSISEIADSLLALISCASPKGLKVLSQTCGAIQNFCKDDERNRNTFVEKNAAVLLSEAISSRFSDEPLRLIFLRTLNVICNRSPEVQTSYCEAGVIAVCLIVLHASAPGGPNATQSREYASDILQKITWKNRENQRQLLEGGGVPVLANLLQTVKGQETVIGNTLSCIFNMTTDGNSQTIQAFHHHGLLQLFNPRFLQSLASFMKADLIGTVYLMNAMSIIGHLANSDYPEGQKQLRESAALDTIVQFLKVEQRSVMQLAAAQVITLACTNNGANATRVVYLSGLQLLLPLLQSEDAAVLHHVLEAIAAILNEDRAGHLVEQVLLSSPGLIAALSSGARHVQVPAARCLTLLIQQSLQPPKVQMSLIEQAITGPLVVCLNTDQRHLVLQSLSLVERLSSDNRQVQDELRKIITPAVVPHLSNKQYNSLPFVAEQPQSCPEIQTTTLRAIISLCTISEAKIYNPLSVEQLIKSLALDLVLPLVRQKDEQILVLALEVLWIIAQSNGKTRKAIVTADRDQHVSLFALLPILLSHHEESVALFALRVICALAEPNREYHRAFVQGSVVTCITRMPATSNQSLMIQLHVAQKIFLQSQVPI